jgi:hypothetical protein
MQAKDGYGQDQRKKKYIYAKNEIKHVKQLFDLPSGQFGKKTRNVMDRPSDSPFKKIMDQPMHYKNDNRRGVSLDVEIDQSATAQVSLDMILYLTMIVFIINFYWIETFRIAIPILYKVFLFAGFL